VPAIVVVLLVAQLAEVCFKKSDLFFLGLHQSSSEVINLFAELVVNMVRSIVVTSFSDNFSLFSYRFPELTD
jgi:hypothetical protein